MTDLWFTEFTKAAHNPYGFGYACAYSGGKPTPLDTNPCGLLHSTETTALPAYTYNGVAGGSNPNFTIDPWRKHRYQHVPANVASRALVTNNENCVQFEIVGYCDHATASSRGQSAYILDNLPADGLAYLAESLKIVAARLGIPPVSTVAWKAYPASYGPNGVRLTDAAFAAYSGWLGHQHAPGNVHGDPGTIWTKLAPYMATKPAPVPPKPTPPKGPGLTVDGDFGPATKRALQVALKVTADSVIGPATIRALQTKVKTKIDGDWGVNTTRALQINLKVPVDGVLGVKTYKALQTRLNAGSF